MKIWSNYLKHSFYAVRLISFEEQMILLRGNKSFFVWKHKPAAHGPMFCPRLPCDKSTIEHFVADVFLMQLTQLLIVSLVLDMSFCFSSIKCVVCISCLVSLCVQHYPSSIDAICCLEGILSLLPHELSLSFPA